MKTLKSIITFCILNAAFCIHSNAQIVYTDINPDTVLSAYDTSTYALDMNNDSIIDFNIELIKNSAISCSACQPYRHDFSIKITPLNANAVADTLISYPRSLNFNQLISLGGSVWNTIANQILRQSTFHCGPPQGNCAAYGSLGQWSATSNRYLGLKFNAGGQVYFGWAQLQISSTSGTVTIKDYAYNSLPNQSIYAGWGNLPANINISGNLSICLGDSTTLVVSGGNSYLWNTGATTASITVSPASITSYSVTVSDTTVGYSFILYTAVIVNTPVTATIYPSNDSLFAVGGNIGSTYQWIDCLTGWLIAGANNSIYTVVNPSGSYAVIITSGACTDTSSCVNVTVGIHENLKASVFNVSPNPATNSVTIKFPSDEAGEIQIVNLFGQIVYTENFPGLIKIQVDVSKFSEGMYVVRWSSGENHATKIFSIIK